MFTTLGCQNNNGLIYLTEKIGQQNPHACFPIIFCTGVQASLNFQHLLDLKAKSSEY